MQRCVLLIRLLGVFGLTLAGFGVTHHPALTSAQAGTGAVTITSVVPDDRADARYQAAYTYLINPGRVEGVTLAGGTQTYQAYDGVSGAILDTQTSGAGGTVQLAFPVATASGKRDVHVININDPGDGSASATANDTVTVVINIPDVSSIGRPDSGHAATVPSATAPTTTPPPPTATPRTPRPTSTATSSADTVPTATSTAGTGGQSQNGMHAAIYAGSCDSDFSGDPVATLSDVAAPDGTARGADDATTVETSFSTIEATFDTLLNDDHVLVVLGDASAPVACGPIGGVIQGDGSLTFGLPATTDSPYSGVAYLRENSGKVEVSVFLTETQDEQATPTA